MGNSRHLGRLAACLAATGLALAAGGMATQADVIGGTAGCAWTSPDTGCSYVAATNVGTVAWVGGGAPQVTATPSPTCVGASGTTACVMSDTCVAAAGVGACTFEQTAVEPVVVSAPGSSLGVAGTPVASLAPSGPGACTWTQGAGGCTFPAKVTGFTEAFVAWVNGSTPLLDGQAPIFCLVPATPQGGVCAYSVDAVAGADVTVTADPTSAGAATDQDGV